MWQSCSLPAGPASVPGCTLYGAWQVAADRSYDVRRRGEGGDHLVLLINEDGAGRLDLDRGEVLSIAGPGILAVRLARLRRYRCMGGSWRFWWFECGLRCPPAPLHQVLPRILDEGDVRDCAYVFRMLEREDAGARQAAAATLLACWLRLLLPQGSATAAASGGIEAVIDALRADPGRPWTVQAMARQAGLSERCFRDRFAALTGRSPKRYYDELRLRLAAEALRGGASVAQVAEDLGFCSPFHFSRVFRRQHGMPPSGLLG